MKTFLMIIASLTMSAKGFSQSEQGLAKVMKVQGLETYVLCEPVREYKVVFTINSAMKAGSFLTAGLVNEGVSAKMGQFIKKGLRTAEKKGFTIDAIVYTAGKQAVGVQFTDQATDETRTLARVRKINGLEVYVMNEPVNHYQLVTEKGTGMKAVSPLTAGIINNSIADDVTQYTRRLTKESAEQNQTIDAVIYAAGKRAVGVRFIDEVEARQVVN